MFRRFGRGPNSSTQTPSRPTASGRRSRASRPQRPATSTTKRPAPLAWAAKGPNQTAPARWPGRHAHTALS
eukprot:1528619-Lingulodinium_polyedra.AAC.1